MSQPLISMDIKVIEYHWQQPVLGGFLFPLLLFCRVGEGLQEKQVLRERKTFPFLSLLDFFLNFNTKYFV